MAEHQYFISGRVLPERATVNLPKPVLYVLSSKEGDSPPGWEIAVSIVLSQVVAVVTTKAPVDDMQFMLKKVESLVRYSVDILVYLLGYGYDIELTQVTTKDTGTHRVFGVDVPGLSRIALETSVSSTFESVCKAPFDPSSALALRRSLADFREAIRSSDDAAFFCFRAVEDIRQHFVKDSDKKTADSWRRMQDAIQVPEIANEFIKAQLNGKAQKNRHGENIEITPERYVEMLTNVRTVIGRFVTYLQRERVSAAK
jgi:hypothetical protein